MSQISNPCSYCGKNLAADTIPCGSIPEVSMCGNNRNRNPLYNYEATKPMREKVLDEAKVAVLKDRNAAYGPPEDSFTAIAAFWNDYLRDVARGTALRPRPLDSNDVAVMMILLKCARLKENPSHWDSKVDIAGYAACAGEMKAPKFAAACQQVGSTKDTGNSIQRN